MDRPTPFLTAEWRRLINMTWQVDPAFLQPHVPPGTELVIRDGQSFVSFVAFDFKETCVKGCRIPYHIHFPEINLRFYLRYKDQVGVAFIREFVPRFAIAAVARYAYNEPYRAVPMLSKHVPGDPFFCSYSLNINDKWHSVQAKADAEGIIPDASTDAHFFKEHELGFGITRTGRTLLYRVEHPVWRTHQIRSLDLDWDFAAVYGSKWKILNEKAPFLNILAEGSAIKVFPPELL